MVATWMMSAELASPGLLKMKVFLDIVHDIIISVNIVTSKTLSLTQVILQTWSCDKSFVTLAFL